MGNGNGAGDGVSCADWFLGWFLGVGFWGGIFFLKCGLVSVKGPYRVEGRSAKCCQVNNGVGVAGRERGWGWG